MMFQMCYQDDGDTLKYKNFCPDSPVENSIYIDDHGQ